MLNLDFVRQALEGSGWFGRRMASLGIEFCGVYLFDARGVVYCGKAGPSFAWAGDQVFPPLSLFSSLSADGAVVVVDDRLRLGEAGKLLDGYVGDLLAVSWLQGRGALLFGGVSLEPENAARAAVSFELMFWRAGMLAGHSRVSLSAALTPLLGESAQARLVLDFFNQFAQYSSGAPLAVLGEYGLGKVAVCLAAVENIYSGHESVVVDCSMWQDGDLEAEVFGGRRRRSHQVVQGRAGQLGQGVLVLREIGYSSLGFQERLADAMREKEFVRDDGSRAPFRISVVVTSGYNLEAMVEDGRFNARLYEQLSLGRVVVPALRRRPGDVAYFLERRLKRLNRENNLLYRFENGFVESAAARKLNGNISELFSCLEFAYYRASGSRIRFEHFLEGESRWKPAVDSYFSLRANAESLENDLVLRAYARCDGNQVQMARMLGVSRGSLQYRLRKLGIK